MLFLLQFASTSFIDSFHFEEKPLKKRFPLARMNNLVEIEIVPLDEKNYHYFLITLMISNSSKIALTKKCCFHRQNICLH